MTGEIRLVVALVAVVALSVGAAWAQARSGRSWIPQERLIKWKPGVEGGIPDVPVSVRLTSKDLPADGQTDAVGKIQQAIDRADTPGAVLLPVGTFMLRGRLQMRRAVVLRGAGPDKTHLLFNVPVERRRSAIHVPAERRWGAISIRGKLSRREIVIADGYVFGSVELTAVSTDELRKGQLVWIYSDNDPELMYTKSKWRTSWGRTSMGQVVKITVVTGKTVTIDAPLRLNYKKELKPRMRVITPMTGVGIEDLHIKRLDHAEDSIIALRRCENCWVTNCETEYCMRNHIGVGLSRHVTVQSCYIHHAHDYGGGGRGYGVGLADCTSDCLVQNNIFHTLRHAMITQTGANGNVYAYNYSFDSAGCGSGGKSYWHSTDISIHGHYPYATLFEGNIVQQACVADYWGPAGPRMTLFRNRVAAPEKETDRARQRRLGITRVRMGISVDDYSHMTNVIGNTLTEGAELEVEKSCRDCLVEGNLIGGKVVWNSVRPGRLPASLYLSQKPHFWGNKPWPGIGTDVDGLNRSRMITLPAQDWFRLIKNEGRTVPFRLPGGRKPGRRQ